MYKTTGPSQSWKFAFKTAGLGWSEDIIEAPSREMAKQILIGKHAPLRVCFAL